MSPLDWLLAALIAAIVGAALYSALRKKKSGSCCGDCGKCPACCNSKRGEENNSKKD